MLRPCDWRSLPQAPALQPQRLDETLYGRLGHESGCLKQERYDRKGLILALSPVMWKGMKPGERRCEGHETVLRLCAD